jgi:hypothetical protein
VVESLIEATVSASEIVAVSMTTIESVTAANVSDSVSACVGVMTTLESDAADLVSVTASAIVSETAVESLTVATVSPTETRAVSAIAFESEIADNESVSNRTCVVSASALASDSAATVSVRDGFAPTVVENESPTVEEAAAESTPSSNPPRVPPKAATPIVSETETVAVSATAIESVHGDTVSLSVMAAAFPGGAMMNRNAFIVPVVPVAVQLTAGHAVEVLEVSAFADSMRFQNPVPLPPAVVRVVYPDACESAVVEFDAQNPAIASALSAAGTSVPSVEIGDPALVVCRNCGGDADMAPEIDIIDTTKFTPDDEKPQVCVAGSLAATFQYAPIVV